MLYEAAEDTGKVTVGSLSCHSSPRATTIDTMAQFCDLFITFGADSPMAPRRRGHRRFAYPLMRCIHARQTSLRRTMCACFSLISSAVSSSTPDFRSAAILKTGRASSSTLRAFDYKNRCAQSCTQRSTSSRSCRKILFTIMCGKQSRL